MIGAGLRLAPLSIRWVSMATRVAIPLLVRVSLSYALSALLSRVTRSAPQCACADVDVAAPAGAVSPADRSGLTTAAALGSPRSSPPIVHVVTSTSPRCRVHGPATRRIGLNVNTATLATGWKSLDESIEALFERVVPGNLAEVNRGLIQCCEPPLVPHCRCYWKLRGQLEDPRRPLGRLASWPPSASGTNAKVHRLLRVKASARPPAVIALTLRKASSGVAASSIWPIVIGPTSMPATWAVKNRP